MAKSKDAPNPLLKTVQPIKLPDTKGGWPVEGNGPGQPVRTGYDKNGKAGGADASDNGQGNNEK